MRKRRKSFIILLLISTLVLFNACSENLDIQNEEAFESYLIEEMKQQLIPSLSILIFNNDQVVYENYLGFGQLDPPIALQQDHLFLLASVSKVVTATALLQLYDQGYFDLDDPIDSYLAYQVRIPGYSEAITYRMLLTHTSGIADGDALDLQYFYGEDSPIPLQDFIRDYLEPRGQYYDAYDNFYNFPPGSEHEYSNIGNALIAVLVERISGENFNQYCKQHIFNPLGLQHSYWRLDEAIQSGHPLATPYERRRAKLEAIEHYTFTDYPNGGLRSTPRDLHQVLVALMNGGVSAGVQLLAPATVAEMLSRQIPSIDDEVGLHVFVMNRSLDLWGHDGGEQGVATIMAFNPQTKVGAVILSNQGDVDLDEILAEAYKLGLKL